jgi:hypothetical protein
MKSEVPPEDRFAARLASIERRLDAMDAARNLRSATIDEPGTLQIRTLDGTVIAYFGRQSDGRMGLTLRRTDGTSALEFAGFTGDLTPHQVLRLFDRLGNEVLGDDETSGQGLARPWLPVQSKASASIMASTTTPTMTNVFDLDVLKQQPKILVGVQAVSDAGTAGQVDLYNEGTAAVIAGPLTVTSAGVADDLLGVLAGGHLSLQPIRLRARRTSGTGSVGVICAFASQRQS